MDMNFTIRPAQAGDVETLQLLLEHEARHNQISFEEDSPHHPSNAAVAIVNATLNSEDPNCGWLAFSPGSPGSHGQAAGLITTPQGLGGGVFVLPEFRGQGIAAALIKEREHYFKDELGITKIKRPVLAGNEASIKLHTEKLGYHFTAASEALLKSSPQLPAHTVLYLEKNLG